MTEEELREAKFDKLKQEWEEIVEDAAPPEDPEIPPRNCPTCMGLGCQECCNTGR